MVVVVMKKMEGEDDRGRVPELCLERIYLRVRCGPGATPFVGTHFGRASQPARNGPSEDELIGQVDGGERGEGFYIAQRDRRLDLLLEGGTRTGKSPLPVAVLAGERRRPLISRAR
jgi:hypothetical protein